MHFISNLVGKIVANIGTLALLTALAVALPMQAEANTGSGATILNVVTVDYKDAGGTTTYAETASTSVTVTLVPSAPTITAPADQAVPSGSTATYTYTITSTANGRDSYSITAPLGAQTNVNAPGATPSAASIVLGASVITAVTAANTIEVPAGSETDIVASDIVVVAGVDYLVSSVTAGTAASHTNTPGDGVAGTTTAETATTIVLAANPAGSNVAPAFTGAEVGTVVGEQAGFTVDVTATVAGTGNGSVEVTTTVTGAGPAATDLTITTFQGPNLSISKEVSTDGGATFGAAASGAPGSTLTYRITVSNGGAGDATSVVITDPMPAYTTYTAGTAKSDTAVLTYAAAATALPDASDAPTDTYDFGVTTANTATYNVGTVAAGATVVLFYQVTID